MKYHAIIVAVAMMASAPWSLAQNSPDPGRQDRSQPDQRTQQDQPDQSQRQYGQDRQNQQRQEQDPLQQPGERQQGQFGQRQHQQVGQGFRQVHKVNDVMGKEVQNAQGEKIGKIKDLAVDTDRERVVYAVFEPEGKMAQGKYLAVPIPVLQLDAQKDVLVLAITTEQITGAQGFDEENWPTQPSSIWGARTQFAPQQRDPLDQQRESDPFGQERRQDQFNQQGRDPLNQQQRQDLPRQGQSDQQRQDQFNQQQGQDQPRQGQSDQQRQDQFNQQQGQDQPRQGQTGRESATQTEQRTVTGAVGEEQINIDRQAQSQRPADRMMRQRIETVLVKKEGQESNATAVRQQAQPRQDQKNFLSKEQWEKIQVTAQGSTVKLSGEVESEEMKGKITKALQGLPGIQSVENELKVKKAGAITDR